MFLLRVPASVGNVCVCVPSVSVIFGWHKIVLAPLFCRVLDLSFSRLLGVLGLCGFRWMQSEDVFVDVDNVGTLHWPVTGARSTAVKVV